MKIAVLIAAGLLCVSASPAQDRLRERLDAIYGDGGYQRELPTQEQIEAASHGKSGGSVSLPDRTHPPPPLPPIPEWLARLLAMLVSVLPWIALVILVALITIAFIRSRRWAKPEPAAIAPNRAAKPSTTPEEALPDAERLAREGRFAEAIHAILLHAIEQLHQAGTRGLAESLTSREIMASSGLEAGRQAALARIVRAVEITLFGGHEAGPDDYRECAAALASVGASH